MVALAVLGPVGYIIASWIATGVTMLNTYVSWLVPLILGGVFPLLVMTGTHYGITRIGINNRMTTGFDTIVYPANLASNIAQGAAAFAVAVKTKKAEVRQVASSAGITAVCGITEPALYGINMRFKTPLISACVGGGSPGLMTLPGYIGGDSLRDLMLACIGAAIAFVVTFIVCFILFKDEKTQVEATQEEIPAEAEVKTGETQICAPVKGKLVSISSVNDPTFAQEMLGQGVAIILEDGTFVSPVKDGDTVDVGTPLLKADLAGIRSEGYDVITPIITNTPECTQISKEPEGEVEPKAPVMKVVQ